MTENVVSFPLQEKEKPLLERIVKYLEISPTVDVNIERLSEFFQVDEDLIIRVLNSEEGKALVQLRTTHEQPEVPDVAPKSNIDLTVTNNHYNSETLELRDTSELLSEKQTINKDFMSKLALDELSYEDALKAHTEASTIDKMKIFQLQYSKSMLVRIIKMFETFELLQEKYSEQVAENVDNMDIDEVIQHNKVSFEFMKQSMAIIDKFTTDESFKVLVMNSAQTGNSELSQATAVFETREEVEKRLHEQSERESVKKSAQTILENVKNMLAEAENPNSIQTAEPVKKEEVDEEIILEDEDVPLLDIIKKKKDDE